MRILKPIFYTAIAATVFVSCKSTSRLAKIAVPSGSDNTINLPAKKAPLTKEQRENWSHLDLATDTIPGMSVEKAYNFVKTKHSEPVIVAIADSGLDIDHEDLKDNIWTNPNEIAGNGKDDDKNGYVDDIHGWNFLGNKAGKIVVADQLEITRIVKKGMDKFGDKKASEIANADKAEYEQYLKLKEEVQKRVESDKKRIENLNQEEERLKAIGEEFVAVKKHLGKNTFTIDDLKAIKTSDVKLADQVADLIGLYSRGLDEDKFIDYQEGLLEYKKGLEEGKHYDLNFNARQSLGDDLSDINDKYYGNNNVIGSKDDEIHATHVAGIVGAIRGNGKGVDGVVANVKLMSVRIVPDGDEHDKDVALGLRYAVDNGAKVINTSFGKGYSPNKQWVFDAIKYAASKDVLIVNAAGNDGKNIDVEKTYPNDSKDLIHEISDNVLTVGAMSANYNENLPATFSNYGKINVDVFAPGVQVYSTVPKNKYRFLSGTSMAAPSAAGVAALVRSYYPQLSASQVKHILMNSGTKINLEVIKPGSKTAENPSGEKINFSQLSVSGRIVNAYNALKMADQMVNGK
ncbi:S8 family serine peptidase [Tenacibaculum sp. UWU-22]|uniref:S8 family serine peptidase n=1 Tax=Tenacibaculum sp. UWU-22 TaxID=3234187 RepID=UPI0034DB6711